MAATAGIDLDVRVAIEVRLPGSDFTEVASGVASVTAPLAIESHEDHVSITGFTEGLEKLLTPILEALNELPTTTKG